MRKPNTNVLIEAVGVLRSRLEIAFAPDTAADGFKGSAASTGHCAAVAAIVYEILGGDMISTKTGRQSHWLNRLHDHERSVDVDLTGDQFGLPPIQITKAGELYAETRLRFSSELSPETLVRARLLAERAGLTAAVRAINDRLKSRR